MAFIKSIVKKTHIFAAIIIVIISLFMIAPLGFGWFFDGATSNADVSGAIIGSYFESGDGTSPETAYEIARPVQLYYFAWLQNLGFFNREDESGNIQQVYFKLSDKFDPTNKTIQMKKNDGGSDDYEYQIPPIGTVQYPFVGQLVGNGVTISNLTVDNKLSELTDVPLEAESNDFIIQSGLQVIGLFGVVGSVGNELEGKYSSAINSITDMHLDNVEIKTTTPQNNKSLIGIVAGYVNGTINGVTVNNSKITVASGVTKLNDAKYTNTSDYSILGYCESAYVDSTYIELKEMGDPNLSYMVFNAISAGDEWGGSINMYDMYTRLQTVLGTNSTYRKTVTISNTTYYTYYDSNNPTGGSYTFRGSTGSYTYLYGKTFTSEDVIVFKNSNDEYMAVNESGQFTNTTAFNSAAKWIYDVVDEESNQYRLRHKEGNTTYYLRNNNGTLETTTTVGNATVWIYDPDTTDLYTIQGAYLGVSDSTWSAKSAHASQTLTFVPNGYITINNGTQYMYTTYNNTTTGTIGSTTTNNTSVRWYPEDAGNGLKYYYQNVTNGNNTYKYYLYINGNNLTAVTNNKTAFDTDGHILYYTNGNVRYFITYNSAWALRRLNVSTKQSFTAILINGTTMLSIDGTTSFEIVETNRAGEYNIKSASASTYVYIGRNNNNYVVGLDVLYDNVRDYPNDSWTRYYLNSYFKIDANGNFYTTCNGRTLYLTGASSAGTSAPSSTVVANVVSSKITDGTNYLRLYRQNNNNISITNTTTANNSGTTWDFIQYNDGYRVSTVSTNTYYLTFNGSALGYTTTANSATTFYYEDGRIYTVYSNNRYYINNNNTTWACSRANITDNLYYAIQSGSNYLSNTNTTLNNVTDIANASAWYQTIDGNNVKIYTKINTTNYYLKVTIAANQPASTLTGTLSLVTGENNATVWTRDGAKYYVNNNVYVVYNSGWKLYTAESDTTTVIQSTKRTMDNNNLLDTYFALNANGTSPYKANPKNTGYVISGSASGAPDIRVSKYPMSSMGRALGGTMTIRENQLPTSTVSSYTASKLEIVTRTAASGNYVRIKDDYNGSNSVTNYYTTLKNYSEYRYDSSTLKFQSYKDARNSIHTLFNGASYIYGLHFMDAAIDVANYVEVPEVLINNKTYYNYQMPNDSIDFTLKEQGFITFFAGSYFPGNDSFFSLHRIFRNDDENKTLREIKEIQYIKKIGNEGYEKYFYVYKDGTCSEVIGDDGEVVLDENDNPTYYTSNQGSLVFDTDWITNPSEIVEYAAYYFEFPALAGEYALGSVPGKNGAYLMYLDIAGGNQELQRDAITEVEVTTTSLYDYPKGVMFGDTSDTFDNSNSIAVALNSGFSGSLNFTRNGNNITYSNSGSGAIANTSLTYEHPNIDVLSNNVTPTLNAKSQVINTKETLTFEDYNTGTKQFFKIVIETLDTETLTNGVSQSITRTVTLNRYDGGYKSSEDQQPAYGETPVDTIVLRYTKSNSTWTLNNEDTEKKASLLELVPVCQDALQSDSSSNGTAYSIKTDGKFYYNPEHDIDTSNIILRYQYIKPNDSTVTSTYTLGYVADEPEEVDGVIVKDILNKGYTITLTSTAALDVVAWLPNALDSLWTSGTGETPHNISLNGTTLTTSKQEISVSAS